MHAEGGFCLCWVASCDCFQRGVSGSEHCGKKGERKLVSQAMLCLLLLLLLDTGWTSGMRYCILGYRQADVFPEKWYL